MYKKLYKGSFSREFTHFNMTYTETSYLGRVSRNRRKYARSRDQYSSSINQESYGERNAPPATATELEILYGGRLTDWKDHFKAILRCF